MKSASLAAFVAAAALAWAGTASAAVYNDATNENHDGNAHMDFESVTVTNDATNLYFSVNLRGTIDAPNDWGNYTAGLDVKSGGDSAGNPWNRAISMPGMDFWIGSWANSGTGSQLWSWDGSAWSQIGTAGQSFAGDTLNFTIPLATLGVGDGSLVNFDFYTTGGNAGDGANDASANPLAASSGWTAPYTSATVSTYQVVVPEPASLGLMGMACAGLLGRRRRSH